MPSPSVGRAVRFGEWHSTPQILDGLDETGRSNLTRNPNE